MRIIKNPNLVEEKIGTCKRCECEFAYTEGDVKTYSYSNGILGPGSYGYQKNYVLCPNCGEEFIIEEHSSSYQDYNRDFEISPEFEQMIREGLATDSEGEAMGPDMEDLTIYPHLEDDDD